MKCPPAQHLVLALAAAAAVVTYGPGLGHFGDPAGPAADQPASERVSAGASRDAHLRSTAKAIVAADSAAGRVSLLMAAALFREVDRVPPVTTPGGWPGPHPHLPGATDEERLCRQVVTWAAEVSPGACLGDDLRAALAVGSPILADAAALPPVRAYLDRAWESLTPRERAGITGGPRAGP